MFPALKHSLAQDGIPFSGTWGLGRTYKHLKIVYIAFSYLDGGYTSCFSLLFILATSPFPRDSFLQGLPSCPIFTLSHQGSKPGLRLLL